MNDENRELAEFIRLEHELGRTIVETIKGVRDRFGYDLGKSKQIVAQHPSWQLTVNANKPVHDEIFKISPSQSKT